MVAPVTWPAFEFVQAQANGPASGCMPSPDTFFEAKRRVGSIDGDVEHIKVVPWRLHAVL
jgi:hypothetical protein